MLKEITESDGRIITFIDELHMLMGAGGGEGSVAASNMLKPMLARGELRMIGATTLNEYREFIEKDAALERRFQQVYVGEPTRRGHRRDPARAQGALRGAPQGRDRGRRARRRGIPQQPLHPGPPAARQGDRPDRRGRVAGSRWRSTPPGRDRRAEARRRPAEARGARAQEGEGRRLEGAPREAARDLAGKETQLDELQARWRRRRRRSLGRRPEDQARRRPHRLDRAMREQRVPEGVAAELRGDPRRSSSSSPPPRPSSSSARGWSTTR